MRDWATARKGKVDVTVAEPVGLSSAEARELAAALTAAADEADRPSVREETGLYYSDQHGNVYVSEWSSAYDEVVLWKVRPGAASPDGCSRPTYAVPRHWEQHYGAVFTPITDTRGEHFKLGNVPI